MGRKSEPAIHSGLGEAVQYHIRCKRGDVGHYVFLPGDPDRVPKFAKYWSAAREVSSHREYRVWTGELGSVKVSACSTGIGGPSAAIAVEELARIGAETFIRTGSCGAIQPKVKCGDLIICTGAVRLDGTSKQYVRVEYPAVASHDAVQALVEACEQLGVRYHVGVMATSDSFYVGQARPGFRDYEPSWSKDLIPDLQKVGVLAFEMETSVIYVLASLYNLRAASICAVYANRLTGEFVEGAGEEECIKVANEAITLLNKWDEGSRRRKK